MVDIVSRIKIFNNGSVTDETFYLRSKFEKF